MIPQLKFLVPVTAPTEMRQIHETLSRVVRYSSAGDVLLNKQLDWSAIPIDSEVLLDRLSEKQLQQLLLSYGYQKLIGVALSPLGDFLPSVVIVPVTEEAIDEYLKYYIIFHFALFVGEPDWVIIHTVDDYDIFTGFKDFVTQFLDCEPEKALENFKVYAERSFYGELDHLYSVYTCFRDNYSRAKIGSELVVMEGKLLNG